MDLTQPEQVVLDVNALAKAMAGKFFHLASTAVRSNKTSVCPLISSPSLLYTRLAPPHQ